MGSIIPNKLGLNHVRKRPTLHGNIGLWIQRLQSWQRQQISKAPTVCVGYRQELSVYSSTNLVCAGRSAQRFEVLVQYNKQYRAHSFHKRVILGACSPDLVLTVTRKVCLGWRLGYRFYVGICSYTLLMHEGPRTSGLDLVNNLQRKRSVKVREWREGTSPLGPAFIWYHTRCGPIPRPR